MHRPNHTLNRKALIYLINNNWHWLENMYYTLIQI